MRDLTEGLGQTEPSNKVFEKIVSHQQQAAMTMQEIMRLLACCECILEETKMSVSEHASATDCKASSEDSCIANCIVEHSR